MIGACFVAMNMERLKELCTALQNEVGAGTQANKSKASDHDERLRDGLPQVRSSAQTFRCVMILKNGTDLLTIGNVKELCEKLVRSSLIEHFGIVFLDKGCSTWMFSLFDVFCDCIL